MDDPVNDKGPAARGEASVKTQTQTERSVTEGKDFERLPRAIALALSRGNLDFQEHGILTFIIGSIDYRLEEYINTIDGLAGALQWPSSKDWLNRKVAGLRRKGWLAYSTRRGPHAPYRFTFGPRLKEALTNGTAAAFQGFSQETGEIWEDADHSVTDSEIDSELNGNEPSSKASSKAPSEGSVISALAHGREDEDGDSDEDGDGDSDETKASWQMKDS